MSVSAAPFLIRIDKPMKVEAHEANFAYGPLLLALQIHHDGIEAMSPALHTIRHFLERKSEPPGVSLSMLSVILLFGKNIIALRVVNLLIVLMVAAIVFWLGLSSSRPEFGLFHGGTLAVIFLGASPILLFAVISGEFPQEIYSWIPGLLVTLALAWWAQQLRHWLWGVLIGILIGGLFFFRFHLPLSLLTALLLYRCFFVHRSGKEFLRDVCCLGIPALMMLAMTLLTVNAAHFLSYIIQDKTPETADFRLSSDLWMLLKTSALNLSEGAPIKLLLKLWSCGWLWPDEDFNQHFSPCMILSILCFFGMVQASLSKQRSGLPAGFVWIYLGMLILGGSLFYERSDKATAHLFFHIWPLMCLVAGAGMAALLHRLGRKTEKHHRRRYFLIVGLMVVVEAPLWIGALNEPYPFEKPNYPGFQHWAVAKMQAPFYGKGVALLTNDRRHFGKIHHRGYFEWLLLRKGQYPTPPPRVDSFLLLSETSQLGKLNELVDKGYERLFIIVDPYLKHIDPESEAGVWEMSWRSLLGLDHSAWKLDKRYFLLFWRVLVEEYSPSIAGPTIFQ